MPVDLWSFAWRLYQHPGVEEACLQLQAEGADVCLLLCAAWLERRQVNCNRERCTQLHALARPWQNAVVTPLRRLRQNWRKTAARDARLAELRTQLQQLELDAERELLTRLEAACRNWSEADPDATPAWLENLAGSAAQCQSGLQTLRDAYHLAD